MQTKSEFYNYIDQNYDIKRLSKKDMYDIGMIHRSLPQNQKNWQELAEYISYPGEGENYRLATLRYAKKSSDGAILNRDIEAIADNPTEYEEMYRKKTQVRDIFNSYRASLRNEARDEHFKEALCEAVKTLPPIVIEDKAPTVSKSDIEALLLLSDLHIGVNCDNFYNKFNKEIARDRLGLLYHNVIAYCKKFNVKQLNICNLGDLIHGNIHTSARIEAEMNLIDQIKIAAELIAQFLAKLASEKNGLRIVYRGCTDNHSRITPNISENLESENLSILIDWYLEPRLQNTSIIFAKDNIDISLGKFTLLNGKKVMFAHGHLDSANKCVDNFISATHEYIDYVLLGHYHAAKEKAYGSSKVFVNGSIVGTEQYALSKRLFGDAEQKLLIFDNENIIDITINLQN